MVYRKSKFFKGLNIGVTNNMNQTADLKKSFNISFGHGESLRLNLNSFTS